MKKIDLSGSVFGRLSVIKRDAPIIGNDGKSRTSWLCKCECGNNVIVKTDALRSGTKNSCGCLQKETIGRLNYKHGEARKTKENRAWYKLKERCYLKSSPKYPLYGGRGITVCDRWLNSYENFLDDMGRAPSPHHSIDRKNVNGNYEPDNCRWATTKEQGNNLRSNIIIEYRKKFMTLKQFCEKLNLPYKSVHNKYRYQNKTIKEILKHYGKI